MTLPRREGLLKKWRPPKLRRKVYFLSGVLWRSKKTYLLIRKIEKSYLHYLDAFLCMVLLWRALLKICVWKTQFQDHIFWPVTRYEKPLRGIPELSRYLQNLWTVNSNLSSLENKNWLKILNLTISPYCVTKVTERPDLPARAVLPTRWI